MDMSMLEQEQLETKCIFSRDIKAKGVRGNSRQCHLKVYGFCIAHPQVTPTPLSSP